MFNLAFYIDANVGSPDWTTTLFVRIYAWFGESNFASLSQAKFANARSLSICAIEPVRVPQSQKSNKKPPSRGLFAGFRVRNGCKSLDVICFLTVWHNITPIYSTISKYYY